MSTHNMGFHEEIKKTILSSYSLICKPQWLSNACPGDHAVSVQCPLSATYFHGDLIMKYFQ